MWTIPSIPGLIGLVLLMLMVASAEKNHPETDLRVGFKDTEMALEVNYILIYKYKFNFFFILHRIITTIMLMTDQCQTIS